MKHDFIFYLLSFISRFLPYLLVFLASLYHPWDFDLGWHLRVGLDIIENHIFPYTNTYSSELPGYKWFNSSWGLDVLKYIVFTKTGFVGLSILGSFTIVLLFYTFSRYLNLSLFAKSILFPILLIVLHTVYSQSFRGQVVSLLFIALLYSILWHYQKGQKKLIFILPAFFFIWANLHAQFILGLGIFALWTTIFLLQNIKKDIKRHLFFLSFSLFFSILATLPNPYGLFIYQDSLAHIAQPALQYVNEFEDLVVGTPNFWKFGSWGIFLIISLTLIIKKRSFRQYLPYIIVGAILYALSFSSKRFMYPMYVATIPLIAATIKNLEPKNKILSLGIGLFLVLLSLTYISIAELPNRVLTRMNWSVYCMHVHCSPLASDVLNSMPKIGKLFSHYNYGGYLIWNYPKIKPTFDGRMPLWEDKAGYSPFRKFITTLFQKREQIDVGPYDTYFIPTNSLLANELYYLSNQNSKWKKIYKDNITSIYTRM